MKTWGCLIPRTTKQVKTEELVMIPAGSIGTIHVAYKTGEGTNIAVAEFDDNVWAWVGSTAYIFTDSRGNLFNDDD